MVFVPLVVLLSGGAPSLIGFSWPECVSPDLSLSAGQMVVLQEAAACAATLGSKGSSCWSAFSLPLLVESVWVLGPVTAAVL